MRKNAAAGLIALAWIGAPFEVDETWRVIP